MLDKETFCTQPLEKNILPRETAKTGNNQERWQDAPEDCSTNFIGNIKGIFAIKD